MSKKYYVDSENVGDSWIDLYQSDTKNSDFLIFYTNRSPRIDYEHMITLMNTEKKKPEFINCYGGNNALDFQLVSYIGYMLHDCNVSEIIIVSNDTGYDAVVDFWQDRDMNIFRMSTKVIHNNVTDEPAAPSSDVSVSHSDDSNDDICGIDSKEIYTIVYCIGKKHLAQINTTLVHLYGQQKGSEIYKKVKYYCQLVCKYCNGNNIAIPTDLFKFFADHLTTKGKKTIANTLTTKYGKTHGPQINKMFKTFYSAIIEIRK